MSKEQKLLSGNFMMGEIAYKNLQVRLTLEDARRFTRMAEDRGYGKVQDALYEAICLALLHWGDNTPITNPGAKKGN